MVDRQYGWEWFLAVLLILITLTGLVWFADVSNADISFPALATALLAQVASFSGKRGVPR